ncbi:MAG: beta-glucosidase BglX [Ignavibacteriaceae bacterium]|nr:beta-glucosidase BglX [Ignavibacteriaceae bacterium]
MKSKSIVSLLFIFFLFTQKILLSQNLKTVEQRVDSVLALMTQEEKIGQLVQFTGDWDTGTHSTEPKAGKKELVAEGKIGSFLNIFGADMTRGLQKIAVEKSRLKIPLIFGLDVIHGFRTTFPVPIAEASSWEPALVEKSARMQAIEVSASGINWTFSPMVDIARDPRWGRIVEGSGEDPVLGAAMAVARVKGYQGNDLSANNTIAACLKHFAGYGGAEGGRDYNTVDFSERTFREVYLKPFKAGVDAGAATLMASFNEIGGVPSSANHQLLTKILRDEWKFDGFVVSDWNSVGELIPHGVAKDLKQAAELALNAGLDMDMESNAYTQHLSELLAEGKVSGKTLDESVRRILRIKFRLGLFDDPYKYCDAEREKKTILSKEMKDATYEVAKKSIVLLKNEKEFLPLKKETKIAVIGPLANSTADPLGPWNQQGDAKDVVSVLQGIKNKCGDKAKILYEEGCSISGKETDGFKKAIQAAKEADVIVLVVGESLDMSGEARSRATLDLPGVQEELAKEIYKTGKPIVAVLMNGRPLTINWLNEHAAAILETWFLGIRAGDAIADVLFGEVNPSGKLPVTFPKYVGQVPMYYNHKNTGRPYDPKNNYTSYYADYDNSPLYPFGYGLSYTKFVYDNLKLSSKKISKTEALKISVEVKNNGLYDGEEVVQLYIRDLVGSVTRPIKELKGFQKIFFKKGEAKKVEFTLTNEDLKFYNLDMNFVSEPGMFKVFVGTNSVECLEDEFELTD